MLTTLDARPRVWVAMVGSDGTPTVVPTPITLPEPADAVVERNSPGFVVTAHHLLAFDSSGLTPLWDLPRRVESFLLDDDANVLYATELVPLGAGRTRVVLHAIDARTGALVRSATVDEAVGILGAHFELGWPHTPIVQVTLTTPSP